MNTLRFLTVFVAGTGALTGFAVLIAFGCRWLAALTSGAPPRPTPPRGGHGDAGSAPVNLEVTASTRA